MKATLIQSNTHQQALTKHSTLDAHSALIEGLADYINAIENDAWDGKPVKFREVHTDWPDAEDFAYYPAALVAEGPQGAEYSDLMNVSDCELPDGSSLRQTGILKLNIRVEVWANSKPERSLLVKLCEEAFNPVEWMVGFRLVLPEYYGIHATYLTTTLQYEDSQDQTQRRYRRAFLDLDAEVPLIRVIPPMAKLSFRLRSEVDGVEEVSG